jgi:TamB, inner membrane protein subunit of TAM complex
VADQEHDKSQAKGKRRRRVWISLGIVLALLLVFHRPILLSAIHWFAVRAAAKQNLKLAFEAEGNLFTAITIRNLHVTPLKPDAPIESGEANYIRADYDLFALLRGNKVDVLESIDVHDAHFVINPKPTVKPSPPPDEKVSLPGIFPQRLRIEGVSITVRSQPSDLVIEDFNLELNPRAPGALSIAKLQLPSGQMWSRVNGTTNYSNRNLILRDIALGDRTKITLVNLDASNIQAHSVGFRIDATLDAGSLTAQGQLKEEKRSLRMKSQAVIRNLSLASLRQFGLGDEGISGNVENINFDFSGLLSAPKIWTGAGGALIRDLQVNGVMFDRATAQFSAHDGVAIIEPLELARTGGVLQARGNIDLPADADDLGRSPAHFEIAGNNLDLAPITAAMPQPVAGRAQINGALDVRDQRLEANLKISAAALRTGDNVLEKLDASVLWAKDLRQRSKDAPWFDGMRTSAAINATAARSGDLVADTISAEVEQNQKDVTIKTATVQRRQNLIAATGEAQLQANTTDLMKQPAQLSVKIDAPQLADFWEPRSGGIATQPRPATAATMDRISGALSGWAMARWDGASANGSFNVYGSGLQMRNLTIPQFSTAGSIWRNTVYLNDLTANLNQRDFANAHGAFDLGHEKVFTGKAAIDIADLATLKPLLEGIGRKTGLSGSLKMDWEGSGSLSDFAKRGTLKLALNNGRFGDQKGLQANVDATYSPAGLEMPTLFIGSDQMDFQAVASAKSQTLEISKIQLDQGKAKYAAGSITLPFIWSHVGTGEALFPADGAVNGTFESQNLDLKKMFENFGMTPVATGTVSLKFDASGTLSDLRARLEVDARDLRNPRYANLEPATFRLTADATDKKLNLSGELKQAKIQPVAIAASMPFDAGKVLSTQSLDENTPVKGTVRLPRSSVNFLRQFVPAIEQLDGSAALDVAVGGTIAHPIFTGSGDININVARFANATLPALTGYEGRLVFKDNALSLEKFRGDLAGGPFTLGGRVVFTKLTEPNLDLTLRADSVLVARNDSLTARADANIKVTGPLASALVKGDVALTNSHFLKNIDIIPIGLPGRPAPEPPSSSPTLSLPDPPLRDWKFDVAIKSKDPFLINGNLATGDAIIDMKLNGTGLHPGLQGQVRLENFDATLPFSTLTVQYGFLYFTPDDPLNPRIELHGTSLIRDYTVSVYVYGTSENPQAVFSSEPPLPQEDIISLLATGTTRQELTGSGNVLASRAALLLVKQLYTKFFKKGQPTKNDSFLNRVDVEFNMTDERTGRQSATAKFKVNDNIVLIGDVGVAGDYRGLVKYLIRFR